SRPSILFVGESITAGHGLEYDETYPAIVGEALGLQVVNLGVHGYGLDQAFLRLHDTLPRFERPVAVITFFIEAMLLRLQTPDHPHLAFLGTEPIATPPAHGLLGDLRLGQLWRSVVPYHDDSVIALAAKIFEQTDRLARERGAKALFLCPR